jgi:hypothetical protein
MVGNPGTTVDTRRITVGSLGPSLICKEYEIGRFLAPGAVCFTSLSSVGNPSRARFGVAAIHRFVQVNLSSSALRKRQVVEKFHEHVVIYWLDEVAIKPGIA